MGYEFKDGYLHVQEYGDQGDIDIVSIPLHELAEALIPYLTIDSKRISVFD